VAKLDPKYAEEREETERGQGCQYNCQGKMVRRVKPEERVRERMKQGEDRAGGDRMVPFVQTGSPPAREVVRSGIRPVIGVEAAMLHVRRQDDETQTYERHSRKRDLHASTKGLSHRVVSALSPLGISGAGGV
jgi:hypothetical protein